LRLSRGIIVLFFAASAPLVAAAQTPLDNLQVLLQLFDRASAQAAEQASRHNISALAVPMPASGKPEERFFYNRLITGFREKARVAILTEPLDSLNTVVLNYRLERCEIIYQPLARRGFWRGQKFQRVAEVRVELGAQQRSTRQIFFQNVLRESQSDTLAENVLPRLEDASLPFTIGKRERGAEGRRWLEPALITSATGVVVYLFYSLRSK